jgi:hypothetical protein
MAVRPKELGRRVVYGFAMAQSQGGQAVSIEERILNIVEEHIYWHDRPKLRAIALDVRKLEDRVKQLEQENDALRADLLLWNEK